MTRKSKTMVVKHSEYQKQYGRTVHKINVPSYAEKLAYRYQRRAQEYAHTPISWDNADELSDDSLTGDEKALRKQAQQPPADKVEAEETGDEEDTSDEDDEDDEDEDIDCLPAPKEDVDLQSEDEDVVVKIPAASAKVVGINLDGDKAKTYKIVRKKMNHEKEIKEAGCSGLKNKTVVLKKASKKADQASKRPTGRTKVLAKACACPERSPPPRPVSAPPEEGEPGPFINYGWADKERETGRLRTFNTKTTAKDCVYESALRALRQRMVAWEKRLKQRQRSREKNPERCKSAAAASRDADHWASSYKQDFCPYDDTIYRRNRMALRIIPHVSHFKP